ncbi:MAG: hypothetical protein N2234_05785 [Planctomycetota bacterium]|nr:hypothetical protein [Planctomycetota bacterium]
MAGKCGVVLQGFDKEKREEALRVLQRFLELGPGQANDILDSSPIVLFEGLKKSVCDALIEKMAALVKAGVELESVSKVPAHLPRIDWPEPLAIVVETEKEVESSKETPSPVEEKITEEAKKQEEKQKEAGLKKETKVEGKVVVPKYEFTIDERNIFTCPACGAMFHLRAMSREEAQEARAQEEIKRLLDEKEEFTPLPEEEHDEKEGSTIEGIASDEESLIVEEPLPSNEKEPLAVPLPSSDLVRPLKINNEFLDIETFEKKLEETSTEPSAPPEEKETVKEEVKEEMMEEEVEGEAILEDEEGKIEEDSEKVVSGVTAAEKKEEKEDLISELNKLPEESPLPVLEGEKEEEEKAVEELPPDELLKYLEEQRKQKEREKLAAARATKRPVPLTQEEEPSKSPAVKPTRLAQSLQKPPFLQKKIAGEQEPTTEEVTEEENYGVVVSRLETTERRRKAAQIMEEELNIPLEEGMRICSGGIIINVAKGLSREKASSLYERFKEAGITARITEHKRRRRR